jgi:4-diphosphocytidyl-2-C-methyl-D-erythritol kinase
VTSGAADAAWSVWPAPAKLNLFLTITGRRPDGLHLLQTVFQLLDWGDTVHVRLRRDGLIARDGDNAGIAEQDDLVVRAARLLQAAASPAGLGADIRVDKRVPVGGGLGGGSSDAATTLHALNRLWRCGLDEDALAALGLQLGADVPVFVRGRSAFAEGVGELLVPIELPKQTYVIVDPGVSIPTRALFQAAELTRGSAATTIEGFISGAATQNAFEPVVRARYPAVARALDWLGESGRACLSGTGGAVFVAVDGDRAIDIASRCPPGMRAWVANGINVSPLLTPAGDQRR